MRIAIDTHAIGSGLTGNERYVRNIAAHLLESEPQNEYFFFFSDEASRREWEKRTSHLHAAPISRNPFWRLGVDFSIKLMRLRPDVFHYQYTGPSIRTCPEVVTIHDISFEEHPEFFSRGERLRLRITVRRAVRSARKIITGSEFSKAEIIRLLKAPEKKVEVIHYGVGREFMPVADQGAIENRLAKYGVQKPYLLVVGNLCRRKNQVAAIQGFAQWRRKKNSGEYRLVVVGKGKSFAERLRGEAVRLGLEQNRLLLPGFVPDDDLSCLYSGAEALLNLSLYEGFGLPLIEAMRCGVPVIASRTSCFPEIAGDAARYVAPSDPNAIADAIEEILTSETRKQELIRAGSRRAELFRWETAARKTLVVYHEAADGSGQSA
jgi:glycosyltransferase involved in cell wall biosynthesis